jgi:hypothetical protein
MGLGYLVAYQLNPRFPVFQLDPADGIEKDYTLSPCQNLGACYPSFGNAIIAECLLVWSCVDSHDVPQGRSCTTLEKGKHRDRQS